MGQGRWFGTIWSLEIDGLMTAQVEAFGLGSSAVAILVGSALARAVDRRDHGEDFGTGFFSFFIMDFLFFSRAL